MKAEDVKALMAELAVSAQEEASHPLHGNVDRSAIFEQTPQKRAHDALEAQARENDLLIKAVKCARETLPWIGDAAVRIGLDSVLRHALAASEGAETEAKDGD